MRSLAGAALLQLLDALLDLLLPFFEFARIVGELLYAARGPRRTRPLEIARRAIQFFERGVALRRRSGGSTSHVVRGLLQLLRGTLHLGVVLFSSESFQATRFLFRLTRQIALGTALVVAATRCALLAATRGARTPARGRGPTGSTFLRESLAHGLGHSLQSFVLLLLAARELTKPLERFVDLRLRGIAATLLLYGLVLIALLVVLQLEQIGEVLGALLPAAAATTTTASASPHLNLHVTIKRFRPLQPLQRTLFRWQRIAATNAPQLLLGGFELHRGLLQLRADLREVGVLGGHAALGQSLRELRDVLT